MFGCGWEIDFLELKVEIGKRSNAVLSREGVVLSLMVEFAGIEKYELMEGKMV